MMTAVGWLVGFLQMWPLTGCPHPTGQSCIHTHAVLLSGLSGFRKRSHELGREYGEWIEKELEDEVQGWIRLKHFIFISLYDSKPIS